MYLSSLRKWINIVCMTIPLILVLPYSGFADECGQGVEKNPSGWLKGNDAIAKAEDCGCEDRDAIEKRIEMDEEHATKYARIYLHAGGKSQDQVKKEFEGGSSGGSSGGCGDLAEACMDANGNCYAMINKDCLAKEKLCKYIIEAAVDHEDRHCEQRKRPGNSYVSPAVGEGEDFALAEWEAYNTEVDSLDKKLQGYEFSYCPHKKELKKELKERRDRKRKMSHERLSAYLKLLSQLGYVPPSTFH